MSVRGVLALAGAEARMTARDTAGLVVPLALPLLLLVVQGIQTQSQQVASDDGHTVLEVYSVPSTIAMVAAMIAIVNMPSFVATYRRTGVLRTLATTPVRPSAILGAQVAVSAVQLIVGVAAMLAVAVLAFDVRMPSSPLVALGAGALAVLAMYAVGLVVAALAPTPNAAVATGLVTFLGLGALGGMFGPNDAYPEALRVLGDVLPYGAMLQGLQAAWVGDPVPGASLVCMAAISAVGAVVAIAAFRAR